MATNLKITELPALASPLATDLVPVVHDPIGTHTNNKVLLSDVAALVRAIILPISLATEVSGDLPLSSIAQQAAHSVLGVTGAATADLAAIVAAADDTVLQRAAGVIKFDALNLAGAGVTGDLPFSKIAQVSAISRLLGRGDSGAPGDVQEILLGTGLTMTGTTLAASSSGGDSGTVIVLPQHTIAYEAGFNSGGTYGIAAIGDANTVTVTGNSRSFQADNAYADFATSAAATGTAGWRNLFTHFQTRYAELIFETIVRSPDTLTSLRLWIGITSAQMTDSDTASGHFAGFRFSTVAGDTKWTPITRDGTTQNVGTPMDTVVASTAYRLKVRVTSGHIFFSINGGTEQDVTLNLPTTTQDMGTDHRIITQVNAVRQFKFARCRITFGSQP